MSRPRSTLAGRTSPGLLREGGWLPAFEHGSRERFYQVLVLTQQRSAVTIS